jgi:hypothetical protein
MLLCSLVCPSESKEIGYHLRIASRYCLACFGQSSPCLLADWRLRFTRCRYSSASLFRDIRSLLCLIFFCSAYTHVAYRIGACVAKPSHDVLAPAASTLLPFATCLPDGPPFLERHQEYDTAPARVSSLSVKGFRLWVGFAPFAHIQIMRQPFAILGGSHWFLSVGTVVRDGIGAATLVPSRLYHTRSIG